MQKLGEAVFIPAGCPHQVRNLKVSSSTFNILTLTQVYCVVENLMRTCYMIGNFGDSHAQKWRLILCLRRISVSVCV